MSERAFAWLCAAALLVAACALLTPAAARAGEPAWHLEQPAVPPQPGESGEQAAARPPVGLGRIGDIEFWARNRGLLITAGNPPTVPPGVWAYNGVGWYELASVCGATDGRIAWAGPDEFWTVSDGRPGQAGSETHGLPPLEDNTLCHFLGGEVVGSYAAPAFRSTSYQAMHGAACLRSSDCWFAGEPLPAPATGAFHLHWDGSSLSPQANPGAVAVAGITSFGSSLLESARLEAGQLEPSALQQVNPAGVTPVFEPVSELPLYGPEEPPWDQRAPILSPAQGGGNQDEAWVASNPLLPRGPASPGEVTIARNLEGVWEQVVGPQRGANPFTKYTPQENRENENELINGIASEPSGEGAWVTYSTPLNNGKGSAAAAMVERVSSTGTVSESQTLSMPTQATGAAEQIVCPAAGDCWLVTSAGWLFHYSSGEPLQANGDPAFAHLISSRPADQGLPPSQPDTLPLDNSGLAGEIAPPVTPAETPSGPAPATAPLLSHLRMRVVHRTTLEVRFQLAVRARLRLLARRHRRLVASTPTVTLAAGARRLMLRLDPRRWPTALELREQPLAALPTLAAASVARLRLP